MKNTLIICFSFLLSCNVLFAQYKNKKKLDIDFDIGMIAEMGILFLDKNTLHSSIIDDGTKDPQLKSAIHIYPVNLY
ncbi:MAG: hypothetical protein KDC67_05775, partial [Ignavibacteriae bacterium]|nr:hypothetical protein [Ignavibacteriota bacterium]